MQSDTWGVIIPNLRAAGSSAFALLRSYDFDLTEEAEIAFLVWEAEMDEHIEDGAFESAWHCIKAAALGRKVFEGPNRLCAAQLDGMPVGIVCDPAGVRDLLQKLSSALYVAGEFKSVIDVPLERTGWEVPTADGKAVELLCPGQRVVRIMERQRTVFFCIAALQAIAIAEWAQNYRRFKSKTAA